MVLPHRNVFDFSRRKEEQTLDNKLFPTLTVPMGLLSCKASKVVFLNQEALQFLEGYKCRVRLCDDGELHIILTGFSEKSAKALYDQLKAMNPEEIHGR